MTPELADKIMTRIIARVEADGGVLHKSSGIEEIIGTCAVAEAEGEIIDIISHDGEKWVHRDGTAFDVEKSHERFLAEGFVTGVKWTPDELMKIMSRAVWEMPLPVNRIGATGPAGMPGPFGADMGDDRVEPAVRCRVQPLTSAEEIEQLRKGWLRTLNATFYNIRGSQ